MFYTSASWLDENNLEAAVDLSQPLNLVSKISGSHGTPSSTLTATSAKNMRCKTGAWRFSATANLLRQVNMSSTTAWIMQDVPQLMLVLRLMQLKAIEVEPISIVNNNPTVGN